MVRFKNPDPVPDPDMKHWIQFKSRGAEPGTFEAAPILTPEIPLPFLSNVFFTPLYSKCREQDGQFGNNWVTFFFC